VLPEIDPLAYVDDVQGALLVQAGRSDSVVPQRALQAVVDAAPGDTTVEWYATDHALDERAARDRVAWLAERLGLGSG
jgi:predicted esterase